MAHTDWWQVAAQHEDMLHAALSASHAVDLKLHLRLSQVLQTCAWARPYRYSHEQMQTVKALLLYVYRGQQ